MKKDTLNLLLQESFNDVNEFEDLLEASKWKKYMSNEDIFRINEAYKQFTFLEPLLARRGVSRKKLWEKYLIEKSLISTIADKFKKSFGVAPDPADERWKRFAEREKQINITRIESEKKSEEEKKGPPGPDAALRQKLSNENATFEGVAKKFFESQELPTDNTSGISFISTALLVLHRNNVIVFDSSSFKDKNIKELLYTGSPEEHPLFADVLKRMNRLAGDFPLFKKQVLRKNNSRMMTMEDLLEELLSFLQKKKVLLDPAKLKTSQKPRKPINKPWEKSKFTGAVSDEELGFASPSKGIRSLKTKVNYEYFKDFLDEFIPGKENIPDKDKQNIALAVRELLNYLASNKSLFESKEFSPESHPLWDETKKKFREILQSKSSIQRSFLNNEINLLQFLKNFFIVINRKEKLADAPDEIKPPDSSAN